ncbi:MAG: alkaline phosphatase family protein [Candidatus Helarchaeales archaeon]
MKEFERVIFIIIDDVRNDQLHSMMKQGELPAISELSKQALDVKHCITTFPSVTVPGHVSLLTGCYLDKFMIPNIKFYHRKLKKYINFGDSIEGWLALDKLIPQDVKTIFELLKDRDSMVIYEGVARGAKHHYGFQDAINLFRPPSKILQKHVEKNGGSHPDLTVAWYYHTDPILHEYGSKSKAYSRELRKVDRDIGKIMENLKDAGLFNETLIVITSDHGNYAAREKRDIGEALHRFGLERNVDYFVDFGSVGLFWFVTGSDPSQPLSLNELQNYGTQGLNLIECISSLKGIERIFYFDEQEDLIHGIFENRHGTIAWREGLTCIDGDDIFNYESHSLASKLERGKFYDCQTWLEHTYNADLPLLPDQIGRLFHNDNRPDLIACTDRKTVYHHLNSHDAYTQESMNVPLLISGTGIDKNKLEFARVVDIVPTILSLLGEKINHPMDGNCLKV